MKVSVIHSITSLKQLPVFPDDRTVSKSPPLRQYNLFYGFNGCGKTTISRIFASLGTGKLHEEWATNSTFTVKFSDGSLFKPEILNESLKQRILVFNTDFISENFRWKKGEANPIFFLGQEQKDLSVQIDKKTELKGLIDRRIRRVDSLLKEFTRSYTQYKREHARLIESEVGLGRRYNATNLETDFANYKYSKSDILKKEDLDIQRQILKLDDPLPNLSKINEESLELSDLIFKVRDLLQTTLGRISIDTLRDHDEMLAWVKSGFEYHKEHDLQLCLLCGNPLTKERVILLEKAIDDRFDKLVNKIITAKQTAEAMHEKLTDIKIRIPSINDIVKDQQRSFTNAIDVLQPILEDGQQQLERIIEYLLNKLQSPNSQINPDELPELSSVNQWMSEYIEKAKALNKVIDVHNKAHDEFELNQNIAKNKIKKHYLAEGYYEYRTQASKVNKAETLQNILQERSNELEAAIENLKREMRQHGPAADCVNAVIHKYLGHKELEISAKDEGYEIRRNGKQTTASPSEGEKTAISLSYFLVLLEADGRKREELIVVMDDPISSLDTRSLNYACSLIKSLDNIAQLIILTHNAHVMNELKKWLKNRTEREIVKRGKRKEEATASLFYIDTIQPAGDDSRRSRITELPKHLREYESEYHYLFHMILRFLDSEEDRNNYFFAMPNVLRKVLEIFLAFKRPGSDGLSSKIENLVHQADKIGIDKTRILALHRLAHIESHGDNIEDLVTSSSMTIEETKDAAEALLDLIEKMDSEHSRQIRRQCRPAA